jgi:hypothetical protein
MYLTQYIWPRGEGESLSASDLTADGENPGMKFTFQILSGGD